MNHIQFQNHIIDLYDKGVGIIKKKNADYANSTNPFKNFESASIVGVSVERAILVRTLDKISRISNLLGKDAAVLDESIDDTILDAINYLAILHAKLQHNKETQYDIRTDTGTVENSHIADSGTMRERVERAFEGTVG